MMLFVSSRTGKALEKGREARAAVSREKERHDGRGKKEKKRNRWMDGRTKSIKTSD